MAFPTFPKIVLTLTVLSMITFGSMFPSAIAQVVDANSNFVLVGRPICPLDGFLKGDLLKATASFFPPIGYSQGELVCNIDSTVTTVASIETDGFGYIAMSGHFNAASAFDINDCTLQMTIKAGICTNPAFEGALDLLVRIVNVTGGVLDPLLIVGFSSISVPFFNIANKGL